MLYLGRASDDLIYSIMISPPINVVLPLVVISELVSYLVFDSEGSIINVLVVGLDI